MPEAIYETAPELVGSGAVYKGGAAGRLSASGAIRLQPDGIP